MSLAGPIQALGTAVNASITALIAKEPTFSGAGLTQAVLTSLQTQQTASTALTTSIVSKLPMALQKTGRNLAQPAADSLAAGIAAYSGGAMVSSAVSSAAASATSAAAPATSASSSAAMTTAHATASTYPTMSNATSTYQPVIYTGGASHQVVGLGALAVGALVAAL